MRMGLCCASPFAESGKNSRIDLRVFGGLRSVLRAVQSLVANMQGGYGLRNLFERLSDLIAS